MIPYDIYLLMDTLEQKGYEALIVGGAVRDTYLGLIPKDYDIATNALPDEVVKVIDSMKDYKYIIGAEGDRARRALTSLILTPSGEQVEITTYRAELGYEGGNRAKPIAIPAKSFKEDASRRDFTINAIGMNKEGKVYDPMQGRKDIEKGIIRAVGNPNERFNEDPLRMIRAIRFSVRLGFPLDEETEKAIKENVGLVNTLSGQRLREEIGKVLYYPNGYRMLMETGIIPEIIPEMRNLQKYKHNLIYHPEGNVYNHYMEAFDTWTSLPNRTELGGWGLLFHDIAKPETAEWKGDFHTYIGHDRKGEEIILEKYNNQVGPFEFSKKELKALGWTTRKHLQQFWDMKKPTKVAEMANNENYPLLLEVVYGDSMGLHDEDMKKRIQFIEETKKKVNERKAMVGKRPEGFAIKVFEELDIPAGEERGEIMKEIERMIASGEVSGYESALNKLTNESFEAEDELLSFDEFKKIVEGMIKNHPEKLYEWKNMDKQHQDWEFEPGKWYFISGYIVYGLGGLPENPAHLIRLGINLNRISEIYPNHQFREVWEGMQGIQLNMDFLSMDFKSFLNWNHNPLKKD